MCQVLETQSNRDKPNLGLPGAGLVEKRHRNKQFCYNAVRELLVVYTAGCTCREEFYLA